MTLSLTPAATSHCRLRDDPALLQALASPTMYRGHPPVEVHETHASWVFVAGDRAYKIKKPVALGFLDYSSLAKRREACREEVRVNQPLAPGLYLGVLAIVHGKAGFRLAHESTPRAVEYAVEMCSFSEEDTFAGLIQANALTSSQVTAAARLLAEFHRSAGVIPEWDPASVLRMWQENVRELQGLDQPNRWRLDVAEGFGEAFVACNAPELRRRAELGLARDGHGDLRCEHVLARPSVRVVDRIEFDPRVRCTDIACDLAFLTMDLEALGQRWAARELISAYRRVGMDPGGEALRAFYAAHWALVRTKVALITAAEHDGDAHAERVQESRRLWSLAERLCWRARPPLAIVICGPAASGKSVLAAELSNRSQMPVVSSDVVRKRLARLAPDEPARPEHYSADFTRDTYRQLGRDALLAFGPSDGVIVDATCRSRGDRALMFDELQASGIVLQIVRCEVPLELALERAARRMRDARHTSDATPDIAEEQFRAFEELDELPADSVLRLDTAQALEDQAAEVARAVDLRVRAREVAAPGRGQRGFRDP